MIRLTLLATLVTSCTFQPYKPETCLSVVSKLEHARIANMNPVCDVVRRNNQWHTECQFEFVKDKERIANLTKQADWLCREKLDETPPSGSMDPN